MELIHLVDPVYGPLTARIQVESHQPGYATAVATLLDESGLPVPNYEIVIRANPGVSLKQERLLTDAAGQVTAVLSLGKQQQTGEIRLEFPTATATPDQTAQDGRYTQKVTPGQSQDIRTRYPDKPWHGRWWQRIVLWWRERFPRTPWPIFAFVGMIVVAGIALAWPAIERGWCNFTGREDCATQRQPPREEPGGPTGYPSPDPSLRMEVAGPAIPGEGVVRVPVRFISTILLDLPASNVSDNLLEMKYSYSQGSQMILISPEQAKFEQPDTLHFLIPLPDDLVGEEIWLYAWLHDRRADLNLVLTLLPVVEIYAPQSADDILYSAQEGSVVIQVNGRVPENAAANWSFTARNPATNDELFVEPCQTLVGQCHLTLNTDLTCLAFDVALIAQTDAGTVSATEQITACREP